MVRNIFITVLSALISLSAVAEQVPEDKKIIIFESEFGLVNFYHELHATLRADSCKTCHHTRKEGEAAKPCHECHKHQMKGMRKVASGLPDAPKISKAFHVRCKGCHQYTIQVLNKTAGPVTCALCHLGMEHLDAPETHPR